MVPVIPCFRWDWATGRHDGTPFRIGIRTSFPDDHGGDLVGTILAYSQAVVTSGTYNRYLAYQGNRMIYHHVFDSRTGLPFDTDIVNMTIVADTGFILQLYLPWVSRKEWLMLKFILTWWDTSIEAIFISRDNGIYLSSRLQDGFELLLLDEFKIRN